MTNEVRTPEIHLETDGAGHRLTFTIRFDKAVPDFQPYIYALLDALNDVHKRVNEDV